MRMYRFPLYGHTADMVEASGTLLCLNGLKSSLIATGVLFLMGRVPKNGLGVAETGSDLGLGEAEAEVTL
jgi:hypothetical protein